ncbi:hypothetical protein D3C86_1879790 [compost metagenome]
MPDEALATVQKVIGSARNEWIRSTAKLVSDDLDALEQSPDDGEGDDTSALDSESAEV